MQLYSTEFWDWLNSLAAVFLRLIQILTGIEFVSFFFFKKKSSLLNQLLWKGICSSLEGVEADINYQLDGI